jgi:hypothetical protein
MLLKEKNRAAGFEFILGLSGIIWRLIRKDNNPKRYAFAPEN